MAEAFSSRPGRMKMVRQLTRFRFSFAVTVLVAAVGAAYAHVRVRPSEALSGASEKYTVRVPNEKTVATVEVQVEFPAGVQVSAVDEKAGWRLEEKRSGGKTVGAVWSGAHLAPKEIVEFTFTAQNPNEETTLVWKAVQIYEDGSRSEWTGPAGSRSPAPTTVIKNSKTK
jgi:uncharacterized protein YcnI